MAGDAPEKVGNQSFRPGEVRASANDRKTTTERILNMNKLVALFAALLFAGVASAAVNINTATKAELEALPDIGPARAQAIIDYRTKNGPFKAADDLKKVEGIGDKNFEGMKSKISLSGPTKIDWEVKKEAAKDAPKADAGKKDAPKADAGKAAAPAAAAAATAAKDAPKKEEMKKDAAPAKKEEPKKEAAPAKKEMTKEEKAAEAKAKKDAEKKARDEEKAKKAEEKKKKAEEAKAKKEADAKAKKDAPKKEEAAKKDAPSKDAAKKDEPKK